MASKADGLDAPARLRSIGAISRTEHSMIFLAVLMVATVAAAVATRRAGVRTWARLGLGIAFVVAGVAHLAQPTPFEQHLPAWVPATSLLVVATGFVEIALGVALVVVRRHVPMIGLATAAYLVAVWPANIYVAVSGVEVDGQPGGLYPWVRLPLQVLFIAWAWWATAPPSGRTNLLVTLPIASGPAGRVPCVEVTGMASRLELRRHRDVAPFLIAALRLRRHFRSAQGGVSLGLRAEPFRRRFWTVSTWTDGDALRRFTADPIHHAVMERFRERMAGSAFATWSETRDREPDWVLAAELLAEADNRRIEDRAATDDEPDTRTTDSRTLAGRSGGGHRSHPRGKEWPP